MVENPVAGGFYFISDKFYSDFSDPYLMPNKAKKYGRCDTILFGKVLGRKSAFLIQNMFPVTAEYFESQYINQKDGVPVRVDGAFEKEIRKSAQRVIALVHNGRSGLVFPDVLEIEKKLMMTKTVYNS